MAVHGVASELITTSEEMTDGLDLRRKDSETKAADNGQYKYSRRANRMPTDVSELTKASAQEAMDQTWGSSEKPGAFSELNMFISEQPSAPKPAKGSMLKNLAAEDKYTRISKVKGSVLWARGLPNCETWSKSDPYCVVKGIRSNNHLVDIFCTKVIDNSLHPEWMEAFEFECPESWGLVELVGLKFMVYDSDDGLANFMGADDFLGGADLDLSEIKENMEYERKLELAGSELTSKPQKGKKKPVKSLLCCRIKLSREVCRKPLAPDQALKESLCKLEKLTEVRGSIVKARNLRNADLVGTSDPFCVVRMIMMSGRVKTIHQTDIVDNDLNPFWQSDFEATFEEGDQPLMFVFDVYDSDEGNLANRALSPALGDDDEKDKGDHIGSALLSVAEVADCMLERKKLEILGESQLLETRLDKLGKSTAVKSSRAKDKDKDKEVQGGNRLLAFFSRLARKPTVGKSFLYVELECYKQTYSMPHLTLFDKPITVREEEDVNEIVDLDDWEDPLSTFSIPKPIVEDLVRVEKGLRPHFAMVKGIDKIVFVSGVVRGASGLLSADFMGKSDPYCIVEGLSDTGQRCFIHRTRYIKDCLCPCWSETFHYIVPADQQVTKLLFTVFDVDDAMDVVLEGGDMGDDFLGRATVDLSYLRSGDNIREDLPLTGTKLGKKKEPGQVQSHFHKNSSISVDVRVERRIQPVYDSLFENTDDYAPPEKHNVSRPFIDNIRDNGRKFVDPSQTEIVAPDSIGTAAQVFPLWWDMTLADRHHRRPKEVAKEKFKPWMSMRTTEEGWCPTRKEYVAPEVFTIAGAAKVPLAVSTRNYDALLGDRSKLGGVYDLLKPEQVDKVLDMEKEAARGYELIKDAEIPKSRTNSLPELATRFTKTRVNMRQFAHPPAHLSGLRFGGEYGQAVRKSTRDVRGKPEPEMMRRRAALSSTL